MTKVAIQGIAGAFHELAAYKFFGRDITPVCCETFREECVLLTEGRVDFAIMAIENTIAGTLLPNYALLAEFNAKITGEVYLHIQMHLLALEGVGLEDLRWVYSHPIAIEQCRSYLNSLPPHITIVEQPDTAGAAQMIAQQGLRNAAAAAGSSAAQMYGLSYLQKNIQTHKQNFTRFLILSMHPAEAQGCNKASLCFELPHHSGSLADALAIFATRNINLTKIQSVPIIGKPCQYWFYVDIEWAEGKDCAAALAALADRAASCAVLGRYRRGEWEGLAAADPL